jgi:hypothetical protein
MTREETIKIVMRLHGAYFSQDRVFNSAELDSRIDIWDVYFKDFTYRTVDLAVSEWIANNKTMPQISELLPRCKDIRIMEQGSLTDAATLRPTWELIWESKHGELKDEDIPPEVKAMTGEFVKWLRADPKMKAKYKNNESGSFLPYEI